MKTIVVLAFLATLVLAENPRIYSTLGDVIYDNVQGINALQNIPEYSEQIDEISNYVADVENLKIDGYAIEKGNKKLDKIKYLNRLRVLSKTDDYFTRDARVLFKSSMSDENSELFSKLLNTGIIETTENKNKNEILTYYLLHIDEVESSSAIEKILAEGKKRKKSKPKAYRTKEQLNTAKINRIRNSDKEKRRRREKELQEKIDAEKEAILEKQRRELSI